MNAVALRKAALALTCIHPSDRRWLLGRLPRPWRARLKSMMADARQVAAAAPDLAASVLEDDSPQPAEVPVPTLLIAVLDGLSEPWAARMLSVLDPASTELYLANCPPVRARAVRVQMQSLPAACPPALAGALADHLKLASEALAESREAA